MLWPNPANQELNIQLGTGMAKADVDIELIDGSGRIIKQLIRHHSNSSVIKLNTSDIASGFYFLVIKDSNGKHAIKKVAIQH